MLWHFFMGSYGTSCDTERVRCLDCPESYGALALMSLGEDKLPMWIEVAVFFYLFCDPSHRPLASLCWDGTIDHIIFLIQKTHCNDWFTMILYTDVYWCNFIETTFPSPSSCCISVCCSSWKKILKKRQSTKCIMQHAHSMSFQESDVWCRCFGGPCWLQHHGRIFGVQLPSGFAMTGRGQGRITMDCRPANRNSESMRLWSLKTINSPENQLDQLSSVLLKVMFYHLSLDATKHIMDCFCSLFFIKTQPALGCSCQVVNCAAWRASATFTMQWLRQASLITVSLAFLCAKGISDALAYEHAQTVYNMYIYIYIYYILNMHATVKAHPCSSLSHCMHASDVDCPIALAQKGAVRLTVISGLKPVNSGYQP